jgi:hypothetical protein
MGTIRVRLNLLNPNWPKIPRLEQRPRRFASDDTRKLLQLLGRSSVGALGEMAGGTYKDPGTTNSVLIVNRYHAITGVLYTIHDFERDDK